MDIGLRNVKHSCRTVARLRASRLQQLETSRLNFYQIQDALLGEVDANHDHPHLAGSVPWLPHRRDGAVGVTLSPTQAPLPPLESITR